MFDQVTKVWEPVPESEFLDKIQTEVLRVFLIAIHSHIYQQIVLYSSPSVFLDLDFYSFAFRFLQRQLGGGGGMSGLMKSQLFPGRQNLFENSSEIFERWLSAFNASALTTGLRNRVVVSARQLM
jgi:hypothetical protein